MLLLSIHMALFKKPKQMPCLLDKIKDRILKTKTAANWVLTSQLAAVFIPISIFHIILIKKTHELKRVGHALSAFNYFASNCTSRQTDFPIGHQSLLQLKRSFPFPLRTSCPNDPVQAALMSTDMSVVPRRTTNSHR